MPENIEQWGQWEQKWQMPADETYENPFIDVEVTVQLALLASSAEGSCMFARTYNTIVVCITVDPDIIIIRSSIV